MSYVVLARKLRPTCFGDLIGQETAAQTLRNAVISNRVAHAFLFSGSRGVGKTSAARILTKALNCLKTENGDPCNTCENCYEISQNASPDVYEIDAASNRGIENIRELRENVNYVPSRCRYKVYIIDEAHMLTIESFNALLKTLEEPPPHAKFIFATTDPSKIPPTIISRCQRYDFLRIPVKKMTDFLKTVVKKENLEISLQALEMIARNSVGGMRDALTSIDQILSFSSNRATDQKVAQILGILDRESRFTLIEAILKKEVANALQHFQKLHDLGYDFHDILADLLQTVKTVSIIQTVGKNTPLFQELFYDDLEALESLGKLVGIDELQQIFHLLLDLEEQMKLSAHAKICFEMAILQISSVAPLIGIPEMINEIKNIQLGKSDSDLKIMRPEIKKNTTEEKESGIELLKQKSPLEMPVEKKTPADSSKIKNILHSEKKQNPDEKPFEEWFIFSEKVKKNSLKLASIIRNAVPQSMDGPDLKLIFKSGNYSTMLTSESKKTLEKIASEISGHSVKLICENRNVVTSRRTIAEHDQLLLEKEKEFKRNKAKEFPMVKDFLKVFRNSKITSIELSEV